MLTTSLKRSVFCAAALLLAGTAWSDESPAINTANATVNCDGSYSLTVTGSVTSPPQGATYIINYSITTSPSQSTVTGSFAVTLGQNGNFSQTVSGSLGGPFQAGSTLSGTVVLSSSTGAMASGPISFTYPVGCTPPPPPPPCVANTTNTSNFNGTPINGGTFIWFNANFKASGIPSNGTTIFFNNSTISFTANQGYTLAVPNAQITFSPSASCASTSFDTASNTWMTTIPISGSDEIFLTGLAFPVPSGFGKVQGNVVWSGTVDTNGSGISLSWKWGAAVYTTFTTDYNALGVKPAHTNTCLYNNSDHAGTPEGVDTGSGEPFKHFVIGGARGGGGSNFTGSCSGTVSVTPACIQ